MDDGFDIRREGHTGLTGGQKSSWKSTTMRAGLNGFGAMVGLLWRALPPAWAGGWSYVLLFTEQVMRHAMMLLRLWWKAGRPGEAYLIAATVAAPRFLSVARGRYSSIGSRGGPVLGRESRQPLLAARSASSRFQKARNRT